MRKIDRETVQRILDTADIVEVVSDFVHLKKRGANYVGLCPFHNERTPSFSVSKSKGICKCFSCGKGGSPVNFIMEIEQISYYEALRYLANKYNIEIKEHEMSEKERQEESDRESMLAVNDFAMRHFESTMADTDDGRNIGLAYFRERGINEAMIRRFHLGYSLDKRDDLFSTAIRKGFNEKFLIDTGLCYRTERGDAVDRFRSRVIYPVFTVSGKVVAFGGRTLRKDKEVAKYVNSPESSVYRKSYELYGLYQAKQAIVKKDRCILVEGYMDVISMHQSGVENVVASSGTSLTEGQIRLIHRFTENVTVIYDADAAGIKASLRGIDLLLAEGLNVKVLLLPEGEDPDSFAQSHSSSEVEEYLAENSRDFIDFKTSVLLQGLDNDPVARSKAIQSIVRSIAMIPDQITRTVYIGQCSRALDISEKVLTLEVAKYAAQKAEQVSVEELRRQNRIKAGVADAADLEKGTPADPDTSLTADTLRGEPAEFTAEASLARFLEPYEREVLRYVLKYGMANMCEESADDSGNTSPMSVLDYILGELRLDDISFANPAYAATLQCAATFGCEHWDDEYAKALAGMKAENSEFIRRGIDAIRESTDDFTVIDIKEKELNEEARLRLENSVREFCAGYISRRLLSCDDDTVRQVTTDLVSSRYHLSKIHTKFAQIPSEADKLAELVPLAVFNLKCAVVESQIRETNAQIARAGHDIAAIRPLMIRVAELNSIKKELAKYLGERILSPRLRR